MLPTIYTIWSINQNFPNVKHELFLLYCHTYIVNQNKQQQQQQPQNNFKKPWDLIQMKIKALAYNIRLIVL